MSKNYTSEVYLQVSIIFCQRQSGVLLEAERKAVTPTDWLG